MMTANSTPTASRARTDLRAGRSDSGHGRYAGLRVPERVQALRDRLHAMVDRRHAEILRHDVREGREHVRAWSDRAVSADTRTRYAAALQHMATTGQRPEDATSKQAFYFRRAAVVHDARSTIKTALRDLDKFKRSGDVDRAADAYKALRSGLETLRRYPPSTGSREADLKRTSVYHGPRLADPARSTAKRESLNGLPADWRNRVQAEASPRDRAHLAVMSLTGARPAELSGVKVRQEGGEITLTIRGAKVDGKDRGIPERQRSFDRADLERSQAGRDLLEWLGNREQRTLPRIDANNFGARIARAADHAGLPEVTAYTFRHASARQMKLAGMPRPEIANRLGHQSERSQRAYG
jgi:integrase